MFTPLAGGTAPVAGGAGDAVGLSPSSPPNTGHSIHVFYPLCLRFLLFLPSSLGVNPPPQVPAGILISRDALFVLFFSFSFLSLSPRYSFLGRDFPSKNDAIRRDTSSRDACRRRTKSTSVDVASSSRLAVDDDDGDIRARSLGRDAGAYHRIGEDASLGQPEV